jgi:ketosteroid isomerase-like protein
MRRPFAYFAIVVILFVLASSCEQPPTDTINPANATANTEAAAGNPALNEAAVDSYLAGYAAAMSTRDFSALNRAWADEFTFVSHDGEIFTKAQLLELFKSGTEKFESLVFEDAKTRIYGDMAVVTANSTQKATLEGKDHSGTARVSIVLVMVRQGWRMVLAQLAELKPSTKPARATISMGGNTNTGARPQWMLTPIRSGPMVRPNMVDQRANYPLQPSAASGSEVDVRRSCARRA